MSLGELFGDYARLKSTLWREVHIVSLLDHTIHRCERCDRETDRVIESIGDDNRPHFLCWECVERQEKRFNTKPGWRRAHRTRRYEPVSEPPAVAGS